MLLTQKRAADLLEWTLMLCMGLSILWKGGKGLDATWMMGFLAAGVTFGASVLHRSESGHYPAVSRTVRSLLFFYLGWTVISFILSQTQNYGLDEVLRDASAVLLFLFAAAQVRSDGSARFLRRFIFVISTAAVLASLIGIAVYVLQPVNRFVGTFFDYRFTTDYWPNAWGQFLLLAWPLAALWSRRCTTVLRSVIIGLLLGSLMLSYSRGSFIVFCGQIVAYMCLLVFPMIKGRNLSLRGWRSTAILSVTTVVIALGVFTVVNGVRSRFHDVESVSKKATFTASEGASSISERRDFWDQSFELSLARPFFGWGPYSFRFVQPRLQTEVFSTSDHPHNVFLKLAMERGWPASLAFLALVTLLVIHALRQTFSFSRSEDDRAVVGAVLISVLGVMAHNLIDFNLQFVGIAIPFWIALGILGGSMPAASFMRKKSIPSLPLFIGLILTIILCIEGVLLGLSSLGRHAEVSGDFAGALRWYDRADFEIFSRDMFLGKAALLTADLVSANAALDRYQDRNAEDARLWIMRGRLALAAGDLDSALGSYEKASLYGAYNYLEPLEGMLQILQQKGTAAMIAAKKDSSFTIFHAFGDAILQNAHFIALSQSVETFERVSVLLTRLYPAEASPTRVYAAKVLEHAAEERSRSVARSPGYLW